LIEFNEISLFVSCHCAVHFDMFGHRKILSASLERTLFVANFCLSLGLAFSCWCAFSLASVPRPVFSPNPFSFVCFCHPVTVLVLSPESVAEARFIQFLRHFFRSATQARRPQRFQPLLRLRRPCPFCPAVRTQLLTAATVF
jgi:hypothetical protein